jgi:hypothetical protein
MPVAGIAAGRRAGAVAVAAGTAAGVRATTGKVKTEHEIETGAVTSARFTILRAFAFALNNQQE